MRRPTVTAHAVSPDALTLVAATWLACGVVLLGLTPLPWRDATLGWSPAFWLLAAPAMLLMARHLTARRQALIPARLASIRRSNSRMMR